MDKEITVVWTEKWAKAILWRQVRTWYIMRFVLVYSFVLLFFIAQFVIWTTWDAWMSASAATIVILVAIPFIWCVKANRAVRFSVAKFGEYRAVFKVADAGFGVSTPCFTGVLPWDKFKKVHRYKDIWLLYLSKAFFYALPAEAVVGEVGDFIANKVRENGGKVK